MSSIEGEVQITKIGLELSDYVEGAFGMANTNTPCIGVYERTINGDNRIGQLTPQNYPSMAVEIKYGVTEIVLKVEHPSMKHPLAED